jgi:hypothetical protein
MSRSEAKIQARSKAIIDAARTLIGTVRMVEGGEKRRAHISELSLEVELTGGGVETWTITIERTASSH